MRRLVITIAIVLFISVSSLAFNWFKYYRGASSSSYELRDVIEYRTELKFFGAITDTLWILTVNPFGSLEYDSSYINTTSFYPQEAIYLPDSSVFIIATNYLDPSQGYYSIFWPESDSIIAFNLNNKRPMAVDIMYDSSCVIASFRNIPIDSICLTKVEFGSWSITNDTCISMEDYAPRSICIDNNGSLNIVADCSITLNYKYIRISPLWDSVRSYDIPIAYGPLKIAQSYVNNEYIIGGTGPKFALIDTMANIIWDSDIISEWIIFDILMVSPSYYAICSSIESGSEDKFAFAVIDSIGSLVDSMIKNASDTAYHIFKSSLCSNGDIVSAGRIIEPITGRTGCGIRLSIDSLFNIKEVVLSPYNELLVSSNPFISSISIECLKTETIKIFDIMGHLVYETKGRNCVWTPKPQIGSGIYFVHANINNINVIKKVVYLK